MSLTKLLANKDVKEKFLEMFPKPIFNIKKDNLTAPLTQRYSLIGTAFDYLLRFFIENLNPQIISKAWIAEASLLKIKLKLSSEIKDESIKSVFNYWYETGKEVLEEAKERHSEYLKNGIMSDKLIESTLQISKLDNIFRAGYEKERIELIDSRDVEDLRNLISLVDPEIFQTNKICILNPTFNKASELVGGADADLILDDMLIDIKTTKNFQFKREYFNQLMGYYTLYRIGSIDGMPTDNKITKLGIYYSRQAYLHVFNVKDIIDETKFPKFIEWFIERAKKEERLAS